MSFGSQPGNHFHEVILRHGGAAGCRSVHTAPDVKKDGAARSGHWRIRIVPDVDQPMIGKISGPHFFVTVIVRWILRINYDVSIVIWRSRIIAPNVCVGNLVIRIIAAGRQVRVVPEHLTNLENSRGRATVSFSFAKTWLVLS